MGMLVFLLSFLGRLSGHGIAQSLRLWGRRVQAGAAVIILVVGVALAYDALAVRIADRVVLGH